MTTKTETTDMPFAFRRYGGMYEIVSRQTTHIAAYAGTREDAIAKTAALNVAAKLGTIDRAYPSTASIQAALGE